MIQKTTRRAARADSRQSKSAPPLSRAERGRANRRAARSTRDARVLARRPPPLTPPASL